MPALGDLKTTGKASFCPGKSTPIGNIYVLASAQSLPLMVWFSTHPTVEMLYVLFEMIPTSSGVEIEPLNVTRLDGTQRVGLRKNLEKE